MSNSTLVGYRNLTSTKRSSRQGNGVRTIVIHHCAGVMTNAQMNNIINGSSKEMSCHYCVDCNGVIGQFVDEAYRSWCTGSWEADKDSITIENSNCSVGGDWPVSDIVLTKLIQLVADIAKRNGITLTYTGDTRGTLQYHAMWASTACCGPYLKARMQYICDEANKLINGGSIPTPTPVSGKLAVDGSFGPATITRSQQFFGTVQDGFVSGQPVFNKQYCYSCPSGYWNFVYSRPCGSNMVRAMQKWLGVTADGYFGKQTITALQAKLGVTQDGSFGPNSCKAWQTYLNNH